VRARIALLREKTRDATKAKEFDFKKRLEEVKAKEDALRAERKEKKRVAKEAKRLEAVKDLEVEENDEMAKMMGFAGFSGSKKG
jgi:U4/U6.U5 tri-snRNP component SNU23